MTTEQAEIDFRLYWNKAALALGALKLIVKNPIWKLTIGFVINIGNLTFNKT
jgi:hypothetical protein